MSIRSQVAIVFLLLIACMAGALGGYGFAKTKQPAQLEQADKYYAMTYHVPELTVHEGEFKPDGLISFIKEHIDSAIWDPSTGNGTIKTFDTNLSLIISATQHVHDQIADLLEQIRRLPPDQRPLLAQRKVQ